MRSQWECLLQNLGEWHGSFTRFSPQGKLLEDVPSLVSIQGLDENRKIQMTIRRSPSGREVQEQVLEFSSLNRGVLFFENGAFSQGSIQLAPFSEFGAELGLIDRDRRLRLVQLFDKAGNLEGLTLIREVLTDGIEEQPALTVDNLLGEWQGEAVTIYPDWRSPDIYPTTLRVDKIDDTHLAQHITIRHEIANRTISSTARIEGSALYFEGGPQPIQVLLLPGGASSNCPLQVKVGQAFFLEVGWLQEPNLRQRSIRRYNDKGEWSNLTLVTERRSG
jgi:hypothetical protein